MMILKAGEPEGEAITRPVVLFAMNSDQFAALPEAFPR